MEMLPTASIGRLHHEFGWSYIKLLFEVYLLRCLAYLDVYLTDHLRPKVNDDVKVTTVYIPSRDKGRTIKAYIYEPVDMPSGPRPVNVNMHGSGFCLDAYFGNSRYFMYLTAKKLKCYAIDARYRKAPEYPCPYPSYDCEDVVNWVHSQPDKFDGSRVALTGFSAGGNVAIGAAARLGRDKVAALGCFYSPLDGTATNAPVGFRKATPTDFRSGVILLPWAFSRFFSAYVPSQLDPGYYCLSVASTPPEKLPDHIILVAGEADVLYHDSAVMYNNLMANGTESHKKHCQFISVPNEAHAFDEQPRHPESVEWRDKTYMLTIQNMHSAWYPDSPPMPLHLDHELPTGHWQGHDHRPHLTTT